MVTPEIAEPVKVKPDGWCSSRRAGTKDKKPRLRAGASCHALIGVRDGPGTSLNGKLCMGERSLTADVPEARFPPPLRSKMKPHTRDEHKPRSDDWSPRHSRI